MSPTSAAVILHRVKYFGHTVELVHRNYAALIEMVDYVLASPAPRHILDTTDAWLRHDMLKELSFRLHDYLAAVKSLVDHSRRLYQKLYRDGGLFTAYEPEVRRVFATNRLVQTVQCLREMAQHYELPSIVLIRRETSDDETSTRVILRRADLLKFGGWNSHARRFISTGGEEIDLRNLCERHHSIVVEFYRWMSESLAQIHASELEAYNADQLANFRKFLPGILSSVESKVRFLERTGINDVPWAFGQLLSQAERRSLHGIAQNTAEWTESALAAVSSRAEIPAELVARIRLLARRHQAG
ncbi:MAG TPA: hypothetical protein VF713_27590 [Thermoanaerobaculia bacterium]